MQHKGLRQVRNIAATYKARTDKTGAIKYWGVGFNKGRISCHQVGLPSGRDLQTGVNMDTDEDAVFLVLVRTERKLVEVGVVFRGEVLLSLKDSEET